MFQAYLVVTLASLAFSYFFKDLCFLLVGNGIRHQDLYTSCAHCSWNVSPLDLFNGQRQETYVCMCMHINKYICTYIYTHDIHV